ncbi:unnamed protein product, partial [Prorocentrum cordatum]
MPARERSDRRRGSGDLGGRQSGEDSNDLELDALQPCIRKASNCSNYSTLSRRDSISMVGDLINDFQLTMKKLMAEKGESSLTSWFRHFDTNGNGKIDYEEFYSGLQRLNYPTLSVFGGRLTSMDQARSRSTRSMQTPRRSGTCSGGGADPSSLARRT